MGILLTKTEFHLEMETLRRCGREVRGRLLKCIAVEMQ